MLTFVMVIFGIILIWAIAGAVVAYRSGKLFESQPPSNGSDEIPPTRWSKATARFRTRKGQVVIWMVGTILGIALIIATIALWNEGNFTLWFFGAVAFEVACVLWVYLALRLCAIKDKFFTDKVKQGRVHFVMAGNTCKRVLANLREQGKWVHPITGEIWRVLRNQHGRIVEGLPLSWENRGKPLGALTPEMEHLMNAESSILRFLREEFGWYWMGLNPDLHLWSGMFSRFQAKGERKNGESPTSATIELEYRQEITNALFPAGVYGVDAEVITGVKDRELGTGDGTVLSENIPVALRFAVEIEVTNALKAQFAMPSNPFFMAPLSKAVESGAKEVAGGMTYDILTTSQVETAQSPWYLMVSEINTNHLGGNPSIDLQNGVMIVAIHLISQRVTDADTATAIAQRVQAELGAETAELKATGELKAKLKANEGEADKITRVERPRQTLAVELLEARRANDPEGRFATAEAMASWNVQYFSPGGGGAVPLLNMNMQPTTPPPVHKDKRDDEVPTTPPEKKGGKAADKTKTPEEGKEGHK